MTDRPTYTYAPKPMSGPVNFRLGAGTLTIDNGRQRREVRLADVETVRMTYSARSFGRGAFITRLTPAAGRSVTFGSLSYRNFVETERQDEAYRDFAAALCEAVAKANPRARFRAGRAPPLFALLVGGTAACALAALVLMARAAAAGATPVVVAGLVFLALGVWQIGPLIRRNRPREFPPQSPPADLTSL